MAQEPLDILKKYWGHTEFRGSQEPIIRAALSGQDVLALLPTGGGKSICYQIPALAMDGICVVVSPLVALIKDQVTNLQKRGIKTLALVGGMSQDDVVDLFDNALYGNYKFLYLSPERLQQELVQQKLEQLNINLIAIDEAHCISQWGNDFRPAYLQCQILRALAPQAPVMALTATATKEVAEDIQHNLQLKAPIVFKDSFSRKNIAFGVLWHEDINHSLQQLCLKEQKSSIVYLRNRRLTETLSQELQRKGIKALPYHGGMDKKVKDRTLEAWLKDEAPVMVATNAFGMGVDKPDVGLVVHYQIPDSLESYFQEAGRAGRNGDAAKAVILVNTESVGRAKSQFLGNLPDVPFIKVLYHKLCSYFQIAYGEGEQETHQFHFAHFCDTYQLHKGMAYNGLRLLDHHSVISLSENFSSSTKVQLIADKREIFGYMEQHPSQSILLKTLLRTYPTIWDHPVKISPFLLSKKTNLAEIQVSQMLRGLAKDLMLELEEQIGDVEVTFLVPREDDRTINTIAKRIRDYRAVKQSHMEHMVHYVENDQTCRNVLLLAYFGEKGHICGICDNCRKQTGVANAGGIRDRILEQLKNGPMTSRKLGETLDTDGAETLKTLQQLLDERLLSLNTKNEYQIESI